MNAWLATIVGESAAPIVGFILLFILVIALLLLVFAVLRRVTGGTFVAGGRNRQVRLSVTDAAAVDNRRRLVLVRRDDVEHLILIGGPSDVVIEQNIRQFARQPRVEPAAAATTPEPESRPEPKAAEAPRAQPVTPPRVAPPAPPAHTPAPPAQAAPAPQIPLRPAPPQQAEPPREMRPPEPPKQAEVSAAPLPPIPPMQPVPPASRAPAATPAAPIEPPIISAPARDNGWQRTASPSFGTAPRAEPKIDTPEPAGDVPAETRTTTAAAFPFAVRNEPAATTAEEQMLDAPMETEESEITLGDMDFSDAFETDLGSELNIAPGKEEKPKKQDSIEDEMERLLGDLSRPEKR
ncbi:flagellar biosynthetic protein FliO [Phyllobacterium sp. LjRoot231]|uniref:hypothetical protein n=1 Tax=Phyllobacterium sp. LjRoot231 TaxID=3342289 RepID=UPI003ECF41CB